jgi:hypothetical protein
MSEALCPYQKLTGVFRPRRIDDLKAGARPLIGKTLELKVLWEIQEGPYAGEYALDLPRWAQEAQDELPWDEAAVWAPSGDFGELIPLA